MKPTITRGTVLRIGTVLSIENDHVVVQHGGQKFSVTFKNCEDALLT
jgi:predicted nuclease of restriction endonuclease-like RecB superfamily